MLAAECCSIKQKYNSGIRTNIMSKCRLSWIQWWTG
jgi:hypothetical protein